MSLLWSSRVVEGRDKLLEGSSFLYGNHSNNFDPFMVNWDLPLGRCSSGVLTAEYMQRGPVAAAFRGIGLLSTRKRVPEPFLVGRILRLLRDGRNVLIYPEGGRRWDGRPGRWIESTAKLFSRSAFPVRPVVTHGSYVAWPRWADWPRPARIRVHVLDAVNFDGCTTTEEAMARLSAPIAIDENEPPDEVRPRRAYRPADGIHRLLYRDPETGENDGLFTDDGYRIRNRAGTIDWTMHPDSRIEDRAGGRMLLTGDLYREIRSLPLDTPPGHPIVENRVEARRAAALPLEPAVRALASLYPDHVRVDTPSGITEFPLEDVLFTGIERNYKLQLTLRDEIVELAFTGSGSALQWDDTINRLKTAPN